MEAQEEVTPLKVDVYRNLRAGGFSVKHKGKVIAVNDHVVLSDVKFIVSQASRKRVLKDKRRNVHAVVRGLLVGTGFKVTSNYDGEGYYNPYKHDSFVDKDSGVKLEEAKLVFFHDNTFHYEK